MKDENDNSTLELIKNDICPSCKEEIVESYKFNHSENMCNDCCGVKYKAQGDLWLVTSLISAMLHKGVGKADLRVLNLIIFNIAKQDPYAVFDINQSEFAKENNMPQGNVSRSLKQLIKAGLLIKNTETGKYSLGISK